MRRRFNYTGRKKLNKKDIAISITQDENGLQKFYADLKLDEYGLPSDAKVWVEAYDRNAIMRFPYGVAESPSSEATTTLDAFSGNDSYYFRVKVVDSEQHSRLFASALAISPFRQDEDEDSRKSLLRVTTRDLGPVPWTLEFSNSDYPLLVINNEIDAGKALARSNKFFQALVYPALLKQILVKILVEDEYRPGSESDDDDLWKEGWLEFAGSLPGSTRLKVGCEISDDDITNWIDDSVEMFCTQLKAVRKIRLELKEVE